MEYELVHYGVKGMRWGVRRAQKSLSKATTKEERTAAIGKLKDHRAKGSAKITKLKKQHEKLAVNLANSSKRAEKAYGLESKAAQLDAKVVKKMRTATSWLMPDFIRETAAIKVNVLRARSNLLKAKASTLKNNHEKAKQRIESNELMQNAFKTEISKIDATLAKYGRAYVKS